MPDSLAPVAFAMKNPDPVAFSAFGLQFFWYGILLAVGVILAFLLADHEVKRKKLHADTAFDICILCVPLGVIFSRLYYVLFNFDAYRGDPIRILYIWEGGLAIYGAIIGGLIGLLIYARVKRIPLLTLLDICAPGLVLAQAIGRWGNFFNQEAFGPLVTNPRHMWFPLAVRIDLTNTIHYATFFYESCWCFLIFLFLWFYLRKRAKHVGDVFLWYAFLYAFERMFVEQLRTDSLYLFGSIRVSQLLSLLLFLGIGAFLIARAMRERKLGRTIWPATPAAEAEAEPDGAQDADEADEANAPIDIEDAVDNADMDARIAYSEQCHTGDAADEQAEDAAEDGRADGQAEDEQPADGAGKTGEGE